LIPNYKHPWQGNHVSKTPLCVIIDTLNQSKYELPYHFPRLIEDNEYLNVSGFVLYFSRIYNEKEFIYSFYYDENIHITSVNHQEIHKYKVKSKFINNIKISKKKSNLYEMAKFDYGDPCYGNLLYDPYRKIYYRFAYPGVELENGPDYVNFTIFGRKKFSIIILDEDFNVIGETLFPEWVYCPTIMFVSRHGLYICNNHPMNPSFNEDVLSFECFNVKKINH
jgi:hypothetical protein